MTRILILAPYPWDEAPSQRFRFELFLKTTQHSGVKWDFQSFYSAKGWKKLYETPNPLLKAWLLLYGFARRKWALLKISHYDLVFVHREITPVGPPVFEWIIGNIFRKKIIFDFDDAIWMNDGHDSRLNWWLKSRWKIKKICQWSYIISTGNQFLADYAQQYGDQVVLIPTIVDTQIHQKNLLRHAQLDKSSTELPEPLNPANQIKSVGDQWSTFNSKRPTVGWTGSHSTLFYLDSISPVLQALEKECDFEFVVIANKNPKLLLKNYRYIKWARATEIEDLSQIDIGIMPLEDTEWAKGKCGFKLIQYGAMSIPSVASPVGVNKEIIIDGVTGYLANSSEEWQKRLLLLLKNPELRNSMGAAARIHIEENYSVNIVKKRFLALFSF